MQMVDRALPIGPRLFTRIIDKAEQHREQPVQVPGREVVALPLYAPINKLSCLASNYRVPMVPRDQQRREGLVQQEGCEG